MKNFLFLLCICTAVTAFSQSAPISTDIIAIDTKVTITDISKRDFYYDNRADFLNKEGTVSVELIKDNNGFYKGRIDCSNGKSYFFTKIKIEVIKSVDDKTASSEGFDDFYNSLFKKDAADETASTTSTTKTASTFDATLFEKQLLALISNPKDNFKSIIVPKEDDVEGYGSSVHYESNTDLACVGTVSKIVKYNSNNVSERNFVYYAESSAYLNKEQANEMVDNIVKQMKTIKLPYKYSHSEPYNVATRRLNTYFFIDENEKSVDMNLDIDMATSDDSNTSWQVTVRITKKVKAW